MGAAVERVLELLDEVFEKEGWHAPLMASLQGLTVQQAAWKPGPDRHSVWMIVNHLSLWKEHLAARMAGEPARPSGWAEKVDWQEIAEITQEAWQASVQRLVNAQAAVKEELAKRTDEDLEKPLPGSKSPLYRIQSMAAHDAYHCGQIRLLRVLQGVPAEPY